MGLYMGPAQTWYMYYTENMQGRERKMTNGGQTNSMLIHQVLAFHVDIHLDTYMQSIRLIYQL